MEVNKQFKEYTKCLPIADIFLLSDNKVLKHKLEAKCAKQERFNANVLDADQILKTQITQPHLVILTEDAPAWCWYIAGICVAKNIRVFFYRTHLMCEEVESSDLMTLAFAPSVVVSDMDFLVDTVEYWISNYVLTGLNKLEEDRWYFNTVRNYPLPFAPQFNLENMWYLSGSLQNIPRILEIQKAWQNDHGGSPSHMWAGWVAAGPDGDKLLNTMGKGLGLSIRDLHNTPSARNAYGLDISMLLKSRGLVLVHKAGRSSHLEMGIALGLGKPVIVVHNNEKKDATFEEVVFNQPAENITSPLCRSHHYQGMGKAVANQDNINALIGELGQHIHNIRFKEMC